MNNVLIGDIHSQAAQLKDALSFIRCNLSNSRIIFLGDIFDSKCDYSDSYSVYQLVREAEEEFNAITLNSNHQDKLIRHLKGHKVELNNGLDRTVKELTKTISLDSLYSWLIRCPFGVVFKDIFGEEYRCAHAYFNADLKVLEYNNSFYIRALKIAYKHQFLYGIQDSKRRRVNWWENDNSKNDFIRVAGHYRTTYLNLDNKSLILDSCCGDSNGVLSIYDVNTRQIYQF